ncbi:MAG: APC family permease [Dehalococcoidales bacterium]|jgi:APA family basic amino acid/polyamine antiporter|nr:APC family permease [Dehalococcoidales bacterium]
MEQPELRRDISAFQAVMILVGYIVGSAIFILVGPLAGMVGPGLFLAFLIAAVPAVFACLYNAQLANLLPVTGANYIAISRFVHPFAGWMGGGILIAIFFGLASIAWGFALFAEYLIPGIPTTALALGIVLVFGIINLFGIRLAAWIQALMVGLFILALIIFICGGFAHINPELQKPLLPLGFGALLTTSVIAYMTFTGFTVITEISGEIKNPRRNIPLVLAIAFLLILTLYITVTFVLTGVMHWELLGDSQAALVEASKGFLPPGATTFIAIGGLLAAATTINGIFVATPRDLLLYGRDRILPRFAGRINKRFGTPHGAILLTLVAGLAGVSVGMRIEEYALFTVMCFMIFHILVVIGLLRLESQMPRLAQNAPWKLGKTAQKVVYFGMIIFALLFLVVGLSTLDVFGITLFTGLFAGGCCYYWLRWVYFKRKGIDIIKEAREFSAMTVSELES